MTTWGVCGIVKLVIFTNWFVHVQGLVLAKLVHIILATFTNYVNILLPQLVREPSSALMQP